MSATVRTLAQRIRDIEGERPHFEASTSLGIPALERALPERRLPAGSLVELLAARPGAGLWTLALIMTRHACGDHKCLVIADAERNFYPPGALQLGIDLRRTLVIRPPPRQRLLMALTQSLRCSAVGAVLAYFDQLPTVDFRRLQLAAEAGGGIGLLLRPGTALQAPSFATARLLVTPLPSVQPRRQLQVEVIKLRGGQAGQSFVLEIDHETGDVHLPTALAAATPTRRFLLSGS
ncbi:MAG: hypothetical protein LC775_10435 [Acidobacteria bacterium]|nr:hypothetical protein [Acidobacteriota bacterium]